MIAILVVLLFLGLMILPLFGAHVKTEINQLRTAGSMNEPVIMVGKRGTNYFIIETTATTTNHVAIGDIVVMTSNKVDEIEYCSDNTRPIGIVPDTVANKSSLAVNNPGVELTRALLFNDTETIEVAIPITPIVCSMKVEASSALEFGTALMAGATGAAIAGDDTSPNFGVSYVYNTSGTGTDYFAGLFCPSTSLSTKT